VGARGHARQTQKTRLWRKGSYPSHGRQASSPISIQCCRCKCNPIGFDMPSVTPRQSGNATGDAAPGRNGPPSNLTYLPRLKTPSPGESRSPVRGVFLGATSQVGASFVPPCLSSTNQNQTIQTGNVGTEVRPLADCASSFDVGHAAKECVGRSWSCQP